MRRGRSRGRRRAPDAEPAEQVDVTAARVVGRLVAVAPPPHHRQLLLLRRAHRDHQPATVGELVSAIGMEQPAVSQQLRVLRTLGLVTGERSGRTIVYELYDDHVAELLDQAISHAEHVRAGLAGTVARRSRSGS